MLRRVHLFLLLSMPSLLIGQEFATKGFSESFSVASERVIVRNLESLNTKRLEFSPAYYRNGLVFVTSRQEAGPYDPKLKETFFELFFADLDGNGMPKRTQPFSIEINSALHEGPVAFTTNNQRIYFTRNNTKNGKRVVNNKGKVVLKIYTARYGEYDWQDIEELPFNDDSFTCMHPTITNDGNTLYFASDRPGGYGGMDIYRSERTATGWSRPLNLGPEINTLENEVFPFIHDSGVLFFSSNGHPGLGGLDLFMIDISGRRWGQLINLGKPFNSKEDDFGLIMDPYGSRGYFTSNRKGGSGKDDLYIFEAPDKINALRVPQQTLAQIIVRDASTGRVAEGASVQLKRRALDQEPGSAEPQPSSLPVQLTDEQGVTSVPLDPDYSYQAYVRKKGYEPNEINLMADRKGAFRTYTVQLERLNCVTLSGSIQDREDDSPIGGTTLRVINQCNGEQQTTESDRQGFYEVCLEYGCTFTILSQQKGYLPVQEQISTINLRGSRSFEVNMKLPRAGKAPQDYEPGGILAEEGNTLVLDDIFYEVNSSYLKPGEHATLNKLAKLMLAYPGLEIELGAHTDSQGQARYKEWLSLRRANSAKKYLVARSVPPERIQTVGYGEQQIRNHCVDGVPCSDEEHRYNRRVEVHILRTESPVPLGSLSAALKQ